MKGPVFLTGLMGSGKTTVGRRLAALLGWKWVDLDRAVERRAGLPVAALFRQKGEAAFRRLERDTLKRLAGQGEQVVSCGGGVVLAAENRRLLKRFPTFYLALSPERLAKRLKGAQAAQRPLLKGQPPVRVLRRLQRERAHFYRVCAQFVLQAGDHPEAIAGRAYGKLRSTLTPPQRRASLLKP